MLFTEEVPKAERPRKINEQQRFIREVQTKGQLNRSPHFKPT